MNLYCGMNTGSDIKKVPGIQEGASPASAESNLSRVSDGLRLEQSCCFGLAGRRAWRRKTESSREETA